MQVLSRLLCNKDGFYDLVNGNIWETSPTVNIINNNPLVSSGYSIDLNQNVGDYSFPRLLGNKRSFTGNYSKFTVKSWVYIVDNTRDTQFMFSIGTPGAPPIGFNIYFKSTLMGVYWQRDGRDGSWTINLPQRVSSNKWYYVEFSFNSGIITFYLDGTYIGIINTTSYSTYINLANTYNQIYIGNWLFTGGLSNNRARSYFFDTMLIDDVLSDHSIPKNALSLKLCNTIINNIKTD